MDWLSEYVAWCKSLADNCTEINAATTDYSNLANSVGGSSARCFIDKDDNLWVTTPYPQHCMRSRIDAAVDEYNKSHNCTGCCYTLRIIEEKDRHTIAQNFGAFCFSAWHKIPISD